MKRAIGADLVVAVFLVYGCGTQEERPARTEQRILDGEPSVATSDDAVVQLLSPAGPCSGTLIAPNLVLTARHCVALKDAVMAHCQIDGTNEDSTGQIQPNLEPSVIEVRTGASPASPVEALGQSIVSTNGSTVCRDDIALLVLDRALTSLPMLPLRLLHPTDIGESMTIVGYGENGRVEETIESNTGGVYLVRFRRTGVLVRDVGVDRFSQTGGHAAPGTLLLGPGMCHGDSGGPAIVEATWAVAGVASIVGGASCAESQYNVYAEVAEYYDVILDAFAQAGAEPWLEGEPAAMSQGRPVAEGCSLVSQTAARYQSWTGHWFALVVIGLVGARWRRRARRSGVL